MSEAVTQQIQTADPKTAVEWFNLGNLFTKSTISKAEIHGQTYARLDCYVKAISLKPDLKEAWLNLGAFWTNFDNKEKIDVNGKMMDRTEIFTEAVRLAPGWAIAWFNLGANGMDATETVEVNEKSYTKVGVIAQALCIEGASSKPQWWSRLAQSMGDETIVTINGTRYTKGDCMTKAAQQPATAPGAQGPQTASPQTAAQWHNLANKLEGAAEVKVQDKTYTRQGCWIEALKMNPGLKESWLALGTYWMGPNNRIDVNGIMVDRTDCLVQAVRLASATYAMAWFNLGSVGLGPNQTVDIEGKTYTRVEAIVQALTIDTASKQVRWKRLAEFMAADETVEINGTRYTKEDCASQGC